MVRRTKQDAQETRNLLLDQAERVFRENGVTRTTLAEIAQSAGLTRGAIYWHFQNKADLFTAMCDRATFPLEALLQSMADPDHQDPLGRLRSACVEALRMVEEDGRCRRVFEIITTKCEFVEEMASASQRRRECRINSREVFERAIEQAAHRGQLRVNVNIRRVAIGLLALVDGLILDWLLQPGDYSLAGEAGGVVDTYLDGIRAKQDE